MKKQLFLWLLLTLLPLAGWAGLDANVKPTNPVASFTVGTTTTDYEDFSSALEAANASTSTDNVLTLRDNVEVTISQGFHVRGKFTLDLNGHRVYGSTSQSDDYVFLVYNGAELIVDDGSYFQNGSIYCSGNDIKTKSAIIVGNGSAEEPAKLTVKQGSIVGGKDYPAIYAGLRSNSNIIIEGGLVIAGGTEAIRLAAGNIAITGGEFYGKITVDDEKINVTDETDNTKFITGGTFYGENPSRFVNANIYEVKEDDYTPKAPRRAQVSTETVNNKKYTVVPKSTTPTTGVLSFADGETNSPITELTAGAEDQLLDVYLGNQLLARYSIDPESSLGDQLDWEYSATDPDENPEWMSAECPNNDGIITVQTGWYKAVYDDGEDKHEGIIRVVPVTYDYVVLELSSYLEEYTGDNLKPTVTVRYFWNNGECYDDVPEDAYTVTWSDGDGTPFPDNAEFINVGTYYVKITANPGYKLNWANDENWDDDDDAYANTAIFEITPQYGDLTFKEDPDGSDITTLTEGAEGQSLYVYNSEGLVASYNGEGESVNDGEITWWYTSIDPYNLQNFFIWRRASCPVDVEDCKVTGTPGWYKAVYNVTNDINNAYVGIIQVVEGEPVQPTVGDLTFSDGDNDIEELSAGKKDQPLVVSIDQNPVEWYLPGTGPLFGAFIAWSFSETDPAESPVWEDGVCPVNDEGKVTTTKGWYRAEYQEGDEWYVGIIQVVEGTVVTEQLTFTDGEETPINEPLFANTEQDLRVFTDFPDNPIAYYNNVTGNNFVGDGTLSWYYSDAETAPTADEDWNDPISWLPNNEGVITSIPGWYKAVYEEDEYNKYVGILLVVPAEPVPPTGGDLTFKDGEGNFITVLPAGADDQSLTVCAGDDEEEVAYYDNTNGNVDNGVAWYYSATEPNEETEWGDAITYLPNDEGTITEYVGWYRAVYHSGDDEYSGIIQVIEGEPTAGELTFKDGLDNSITITELPAGAEDQYLEVYANTGSGEVLVATYDPIVDEMFEYDGYPVVWYFSPTGPDEYMWGTMDWLPNEGGTITSIPGWYKAEWQKGNVLYSAILEVVEGAEPQPLYFANHDTGVLYDEDNPCEWNGTNFYVDVVYDKDDPSNSEVELYRWYYKASAEDDWTLIYDPDNQVGDFEDCGKVTATGWYKAAYSFALTAPAPGRRAGQFFDYEGVLEVTTPEIPLDALSWTMVPTKGNYNGMAQDPVVRVFQKIDGANQLVTNTAGYAVKYFSNVGETPIDADSPNDKVVSFSATDFETAVEVEEMRHVGSYFVQVGLLTGDGDDTSWQPIGTPKTYTINKIDVSIELTRIDLQYGSAVADLEPNFKIKTMDGDKTSEQVIEGTSIPRYEFDTRGVGGVRADQGWSDDLLIPNAPNNPLFNYGVTTSDADHTVYVKEELYDDETNEYLGSAYYDNYNDQVVRASAYINSVKGELTVIIDANNFTKIYGFDDPDYNNAVYQSDDAKKPFYTTEPEKVGQKLFTAKNQAGADVPVTLYRPDYLKKTDGTFAANLKEEGIDPATEAIGKHALDIDLTKNKINDIALDTYYNITIKYAGEETPQPYTDYAGASQKGVWLDITPYDITPDPDPTPEPEPNPEPGPEPGPEPEPEPEPEPTPTTPDKFEIIMPELVYNAEYQYADPTIIFHHDVLGDLTLSTTDDAGSIVGYEDDGDELKVVEKCHKFTNESKDYYYSKWTAAWKPSDAEITAAADYADNRNVARNAETAAVEEKATIRVHALETKDADGNYTSRFIGVKTQEFGIDPYELAVKVADNASMEYAGEKTNFGIALQVSDPDAEGYNQVYKKEKATEKTRILDDLGVAVTAYDPDGEYGYTYTGGVGTVTVGVKPEAQSAVNVIMAASNYTLVFADGESTITTIALEFTILAQTSAYPVPTGEAYTKPTINSTVSDATIQLTSGTMPTGMTVEEFFTKVISTGNTMVGKQTGVLDGVKSAEAQKDIYSISVIKGDLTITPLDELHLGYTDIKQALYDHQGDLKTKLATDGVAGYEDYSLTVYLPARKMTSANGWYEWVLPFETEPRDFFYPIVVKDDEDKITDVLDSRWQYGAINTLDLTKTQNGNVVFDVQMGKVAANTPFLVKIDKDIEAADMAKVNFTGVTIAEFDYLTKLPTTGTLAENGVQFVGHYDPYTVKAEDTNKMFVWKANGHPVREFWKGGPNTAGKVQEQTKAYLEFPSEAAADGARIFIEESDGTMTAIKAIGVATEFDAPTKVAEGWYTINGMKLNAKPTQKGTYIYNGKKVYVK